jgi:ABC-type antimicrobial peptide transport system ATPase subunit
MLRWQELIQDDLVLVAPVTLQHGEQNRISGTLRLSVSVKRRTAVSMTYVGQQLGQATHASGWMLHWQELIQDDLRVALLVTPQHGEQNRISGTLSLAVSVKRRSWANICRSAARSGTSNDE